jgi:hypothetical protein
MFEVSSHMPYAVAARSDIGPGFAAVPTVDIQKI